MGSIPTAYMLSACKWVHPVQRHSLQQHRKYNMSNKEAKVYEETFFIVPRYIRKLPGMTLSFLDVYETIFQFWNKNLPCFLSNPAIAVRTEVSLRQVKQALTFLEEKNELIRKKQAGKRYLIQPEKSVEFVQEGAPPPCTNIAMGRSTALSWGAAPPTEYKEVEYKENTTSEPCSPIASIPSGATPLDLASIFAEELPESPQPSVNVLTKSLDAKSRQAINCFKRYWKKKVGVPLTEQGFRDFLKDLRESCPGFLAEYTNKRGRRQKNGFTSIINDDNFQKYLDGTLY